VYRALPVLVLAAAMAGCAQLPRIAPQTLEPGGFELSGRLAVRHGEEAMTGHIQWRHGDERDDLLITNALGQGVARISRSGNEASLQTSDSRTYRAADAEALTEQVLGWRLPIAGLPQWVRARALPDRPAELRRDGDQRVLELRQDEWKIDYLEYKAERPTRLQLSRADIEIRLVIDTWQEGLP
jgi:outer membrane lipoprotein LolB